MERIERIEEHLKQIKIKLENDERENKLLLEKKRKRIKR